ncbi:MAG: hypothetical protein ACREGR_02920, partial [Minisyncoccia bacterium]
MKKYVFIAAVALFLSAAGATPTMAGGGGGGGGSGCPIGGCGGALCYSNANSYGSTDIGRTAAGSFTLCVDNDGYTVITPPDPQVGQACTTTHGCGSAAGTVQSNGTCSASAPSCGSVGGFLTYAMTYPSDTWEPDFANDAASGGSTGEYSAALAADASAHGALCSGGKCGNFNPYGVDPEQTFSSGYFLSGFPDGIWGYSGAAGGQYTVPTAQRVCQIANGADASTLTVPVDSTITETGYSLTQEASPHNDNTLLYNGSQWDLFENDHHYTIIGGNNGSYVLNGLTCTSYSVPQQELYLTTSSITAGQSATLFYKDNKSYSNSAETCSGVNFTPNPSTAASCTAGTCTGGDTLPIDGAVTVSPAQTTTYTYHCTNVNGSTDVSVTLTVIPLAVSCAATTINNCALPTTASGLSAGSCVSGYAGACNYSCTNGTWSANNNSCAVPLAPTVTANVTPSIVDTSQTFDVTMNSTNATSCTWSRTGSYAGNWTNQSLPSGTSYDSGSLQWPAGNATWSFTCTGAGGSASGSASVTVSNAPVAGTCGTANGQSYPYGSTVYGSYTQCGNGSPSNTTFPSAGNSSNWTCSGANGGSASPTCSASQAGPGPVAGTCGTANGQTYPYGSTVYGSYTQCGSGSPSNTTFPSAGNGASWTCSGANGGSASPSCSASQAAPAACALPWGGTTADSTSVTAYQSSSVTSPATCSSQTRTCSNGTLSGSYQYPSCTVNPAPPSGCATPSAALAANPSLLPQSNNGTTLSWTIA